MEGCILFSLDDEPPSSPPRSLLPLMLTCRRFHQLLHPSNNPRLYRRIFYRKFDGASLARRFPPSSVDDASRFFPELCRRFRALRCIRSGDIHHPDLEDALLTAYIMVLEHDSLNYQHLLDVSLPALLDRYINERLHRGHNLWPVEDTCNTLAVALFWHMTSQDALNGEPIDSRERMMDTILLPLTFAWFRYSLAEPGLDPYTLVYGSSSTWTSPHTHPEVPPPVTVPINYLGHELHLRLPPIALSASLAYFARLFPLTHPPYTRHGPTVEDIDEYNRDFRTRTVPRGPGFPDNNLPIGGVSLTPSACHDWDWLRSLAEDLSGSVGRYTPGTLTGTWRGTVLAPYDRDFTRFMTGEPEARPASIPGHSSKPFSCTLEEHVRYSTPISCLSGHEWDDPSFIPAFPLSPWTRRENGIELSDEQSSTKVFYKTFNRESRGEEPENVQSDSANEEIVDVILSGETEQSAWGNYEFSGRVRVSDGLVVLVRQLPSVKGARPRDRRIYAGYVFSSQNFVGRWKYCSPGAQWEGIFCLSKAD